MLENLHVKNLALIKEAEIDFRRGLNILSGETGAGKSIVIGSVNMALGGKAQKEMIRNEEEYALVELIFSIETDEQRKMLKTLELPDEDDEIIIQRKLSNSRSVCKVNGETVSQKQLQQLADLLIDIHGQHDNQFLLNKAKHLEILDEFGKDAINPLKDDISKLYGEYHKKQEEWNHNDIDEKQREREISLLQYEADEIAAATLKDGEDTDLEEMFRRMSNSKRLMEAVAHAEQYLGSDSSEGATGSTERALRELNSIRALDQKAEALYSSLSELDIILNDFLRELNAYGNELEYDEKDFFETQERLNTINHLKEKYGNTIEKILKYKEEADEKIAKMSDYELYRDALKKQLDILNEKLTEQCNKLSKLRKKYALKLCDKLRESLRGLNFLDVQVELKFEKLEHFSASGNDDVEFMISMNPGEPLKPLCNVASGGELSRIMLGLKTIQAGGENGKTFIFDEIDAGISGKTAWKVAEKLGFLGKEHQIITITHLPQIAAMGDTHFSIEKKVEDQKTQTIIRRLSEEESIEEMARLLGGDVISESARLNAKEMREIAKSKQY